jgi:predicted DNA-binding transcriptional regulator AlpA
MAAHLDTEADMARRRTTPLPLIPATTTLEPMLTGQQAAHLLGCTVNALEQWRQRGVGPRYHKLGALVRYQESDLVEWLRGCVQETADTRRQTTDAA